MVILLALYPLVAAAGLVVLDRLFPVGIVACVTSSPIFASILSAAVLAAVIIAALRQRDNVVLLSAWLFFFCGELILALGYVMEPFVPPGAHWIEDLFEITSFFPLLVFVAYIASPMRLVILPRARRRAYPVLGALLLIGAIAVAFVPWVVGLESARQSTSAERILHLPQTVLDIVLLEPIALVLLAIGVSRSSRPYLFLGIGLALLLPEDMLVGYGILHAGGILGGYAHFVFVISQLYILNGALLACCRNRPEPDAEPATDTELGPQG
jgi:hypothetical protein